MYAIMKKGNGEYYTSLVFGYYNTSKHENGCEYSSNDFYNRHYIVLNEKKDKLINQVQFDRNNRYLVPLILIVDPTHDDWVTDKNENGCVNFLPNESLLQFVDTDSVPFELLARCIEEDSKIQYSEYKTVKNSDDAYKLWYAAGGFHDAYIKELKKDKDSLYVLFDGTWGCQIELWFDGDVSYSTESRDPKYYDPYWGDSTLICNNGCFILVDEEDMTEEKIGNGYCWFKGCNLKYHIIPD